MDQHIHLELDILEMLGVLYARSAACLSVIRADYSRHEQEYLQMMYSEEDIIERVKRRSIANATADIASNIRMTLAWTIKHYDDTNKILSCFKKGYPHFVQTFSPTLSFFDYSAMLNGHYPGWQTYYIVSVYVFLRYANDLPIAIEATNQSESETLLFYGKWQEQHNAATPPKLEPFKSEKKLVEGMAEAVSAGESNAFTDEATLAALEMMMNHSGVVSHVLESISITKKDMLNIVRIAHEYMEPTNPSLQELRDTSDWFFDTENSDQYIYGQMMLNAGLLSVLKLCKAYTDAKKIAVKQQERADRLRLYQLTAEQQEQDAITKQTEFLQTKVSKLNQDISALQIENDRLKVENINQATQIADLQEYISFLEQGQQVEHTETATNEDAEYPEGTILWGGHERWQSRFCQAHPQVKILSGSDKNKNTDIFNSTVPLVLINTSNMGHAAWYKYMPVIKSLGIPYKFI